MQTFSTGYLLLIYNKETYDSVLQNALNKFLADHYTVDYNAEQDMFSKFST